MTTVRSLRTTKRLNLLVVALLVLMTSACSSGESADGGSDTTGGEATTETTSDAQSETEATSGADGDIVPIRLGSISTTGLAIGHVFQAEPAGLRLEGRGNQYLLETIQFSGSPEIVQGVAAGTLDAGAIGSTAIFPLLERGIDVTIVGEYFEESSEFLPNHYMVRADSGIETAEDMRGRTVATNSVGSPVYWMAVSYLREQAGLEPDQDYEVLAVPFPNLFDALSSGEVDLAPIIQPWLGQALGGDEFGTLFTTAEVLDPYVQTLLVFRSEFIDENPEAVEAFLADWRKSAEFVRDDANHDAVVGAVAEVTEIPAEGLGFVGTEDHFKFPEAGAPNVEGIQAAWDWFADVGAISERYDVNEYIDEELLP